MRLCRSDLQPSSAALWLLSALSFIGWLRAALSRLSWLLRFAVSRLSCSTVNHLRCSSVLSRLSWCVLSRLSFSSALSRLSCSTLNRRSCSSALSRLSCSALGRLSCSTPLSCKDPVEHERPRASPSHTHARLRSWPVAQRARSRAELASPLLRWATESR